ncbi:MAG: membrane dipeptidase [Eubacteriales bacterium]
MPTTHLIDFHCDTLTRYAPAPFSKEQALDHPRHVLALSALPQGVGWAQFYAIYIPDFIRGTAAKRFFEKKQRLFYEQMETLGDKIAPCTTCEHMEEAWNLGKTAAFLAVENGSVLCGDLSRVKLLAEGGVRAITLVWNGENEIASGHTTQHGLSDFGRLVVPEMEKNGILVDVSHLNDVGFFEVLDLATKPFIATHSNARAVCAHNRNLTDEMILEMIARDCLIGLNYCKDFLKEKGEVTDLDDIYRHISHFFDLGGQKNLALGSDFDGASIPSYLNTPAKSASLYDYLLSRGVSETDTQGILYQNGWNFLKANL